LLQNGDYFDQEDQSSDARRNAHTGHIERDEELL
jgi:hypothetical protein